MGRYKGLTQDQRDDVLLAVREDTMVQAGQGFPADQAEIAVPSDGDVINAWTDAGRGGAFLNARGDDVPTYNASANGLDLDVGEDYHVCGDIRTPNLEYFERFRTGGITAVVRVDLQTTLSAGGSATIMGDATPSGTTGFELRYEADSTPSQGIRAVARNGGADLYDTGQQDVTIGSGLDTIEFTLSTSGRFRIEYNDTIVVDATSASTMGAGAASDNIFGLGTSGGLATDGDIDAVVQGVLIDSTSERQEAAEGWIKGNDYTP